MGLMPPLFVDLPKAPPGWAGLQGYHAWIAQLAEVSRFRSQPRSSIPFAEKPLEPDSGGGPAHDCPRTLNSSANIFNSQRRGSLNLRLCLDLDGLCFQVGRSPLQLLHNTPRKGLPPFGVDLAIGPPVSHIFMGTMIWQARVSRL